MALVTYNGVKLPYALSESFEQASDYDESQTDRLYTKIDYSAQFLINTNYISAIDGTVAAATSPANIMKGIRQKLLTHRKSLSVTMNGVELVPSAQGGNQGTVDAKNGPLPQYCNIQAMTDSLFLVNYRIIAHYWENNTPADPQSNAQGDNVIYNRWSENVEIDERNRNKRTRSGKITIRSDNLEGFTPDDKRSDNRKLRCTLSLIQGFRRLSAQYGITPDGLTLTYNFVDQEEYLMPPDPAFKARGKYIETSTKDGGWRMGVCEVTLEGEKPIQNLQGIDMGSKNTLLEIAAGICINKLRAEGIAMLNGKIAKLERVVVEDDLYDNIVSIRVEALMEANIPGVRVVNGARMQTNPLAYRLPLRSLDVQRLLSLPSGATQVPPAHRTAGTGGYLLQAAAYYNPNLVKTLLGNDGQLSTGKQPGTAGPAAV